MHGTEYDPGSYTKKRRTLRWFVEGPSASYHDSFSLAGVGSHSPSFLQGVPVGAYGTGMNPLYRTEF